MAYKIIVADDHPITLLGTETYLNTLNYKVIGSYGNGVSCLNGIMNLLPDLVITDVSMPGISGLEILKTVKQKKLKTKVILLTMHKEMSVFLKAKEYACDGYVLKDFAQNELHECIKLVMTGNTFISPEINLNQTMDENPDLNLKLSALTPTERKVLDLVSEQKSNKEIGIYLFISEKTVETHKRNISEKLEIPKVKNALLLWSMKNLKK
jgi:DNA-binding NarL/FixJ family response regulator